MRPVSLTILMHLRSFEMIFAVIAATAFTMVLAVLLTTERALEPSLAGRRRPSAARRPT